MPVGASLAPTTRRRLASHWGEHLRQGPIGDQRLAFAVVGAQKCGTSALWSFLAVHPGVGGGGGKELHAFDDEGFDWDAGVEHPQVVQRLLACRHDQLAGDATPSTMWWPRAADRLVAHNPDVRLVAVLRDPVARAVSHWRMEVDRGNEDRPFVDAARAEVDAGFPVDRVRSYVGRGLYARQLDALERLVRPAQLLVVGHADLVGDHAGTLRRVVDHLGLPPFPTVPTPRRVHVGAGPEARLAPTDRRWLADVFADSNTEVADRWGVQLG